jgi:hypothetical protein
MVSPQSGHSFDDIDISWAASYGAGSVEKGTGEHRAKRNSVIAVSVLDNGPHDARDVSGRCFADEVAIDFPSVASAVSRIRHGLLLDESSLPLPAVLSLSRREARAGVTTPLCVSVRATCRSCGGRGESWAEACIGCDGSGAQLRAHTVQVSVPKGVADGAIFRFSVTPRYQPSTRIELRILVS